MKRVQPFFNLFIVPAIVGAGIAAYLILHFGFQSDRIASIIIGLVIAVGSIDLVRETVQSIARRQFALDYIAIIAISTAVVSGELLVAAVIVLMLAGGQTLEKFAVARAKKSLTALINRIPSSVLLWDDNDIGKKVDIAAVAVGQTIFVRKGEVIPLDGLLVSPEGLADKSSLTGEPYEIEKQEGDTVRSGTVNIGKPMVVAVTHVDRDSTYRKIVDMVRRTQEEQSPLIRIADRYSTVFTTLTFAIVVLSLFLSGDTSRVLAILVIATPCPLILATPIALIGGVNALAKRKVIVKNLVSLESLSRVTDILFDKTGTITLGWPMVTEVLIKESRMSRRQILAVAAAIERNSLHPYAKAIVAFAKEEGAPHVRAHDVVEQVGHGITGRVGGRRFSLTKSRARGSFAVEMRAGTNPIALFHFQDRIKGDSKHLFQTLKKLGLHISIFTGDRQQEAQRVADELGTSDIAIEAQCSPEDKLRGIKKLRREGRVTAMVGDGINDAPALAAADVGMVFSNEEQTAASEAADIIFLGGDVSLVLTSHAIARRTLGIAIQSIVVGIGLSAVGMVLAAFGYIPPIAGAFIQEGLDVLVILNALRASK